MAIHLHVHVVTSKSWRGCRFIERKRKHCAVKLAPCSEQLYSGIQYNSTELVARTGVNVAKQLCDIIALTGVNIAL
jgi:hypothetical protein